MGAGSRFLMYKDEDEALEAARKALDLGITYIDTSDDYGKDYLSQRRLGKVLKGYGNDGRSGFEGVREGTVVGTYLHGPLLPKNAWFADWLTATALRRAPSELAPLDDRLEDAAHAAACRAAGV